VRSRTVLKRRCAGACAAAPPSAPRSGRGVDLEATAAVAIGVPSAVSELAAGEASGPRRL
jgi:hypothetical protein